MRIPESGHANMAVSRMIRPCVFTRGGSRLALARLRKPKTIAF